MKFLRPDQGNKKRAPSNRGFSTLEEIAVPDGKALPGSRLKGMDGGPESGKPSAIQGRSGHFLDHHAPPFLPVRDPTSQEPARTPSEPLCSCQAPDPLGERARGPESGRGAVSGLVLVPS